MESPLYQADRRRPRGYDWLLALFAPMHAIAYHHRRAGFSLLHVFVLTIANQISALLNFSMLTMLVRGYVEQFIQVFDIDMSKVSGRSPAADLAEVWEQATRPENTDKLMQRIAGRLYGQSSTFSSSSKATRLFQWFIIALAFYVVWAAKSGTKQARRELVEGCLIAGHPTLPSSSLHPLLASPKGSGPAFMAYAIAVMYPGVSYSIHSDRRLVGLVASLAVGLLYGSACFFFSLAVALQPLLSAKAQAGVALRSVDALFAMAAVLFALYLVGPVRAAVMNVKHAREKYAKTFSFE